LPNKNYEFAFQISGRKEYKDITIFFWRGKVTSLTNLRELVRPSAPANCWDSKDPSGNLTSINMLTVQQIFPYYMVTQNSRALMCQLYNSYLHITNCVFISHCMGLCTRTGYVFYMLLCDFRKSIICMYVCMYVW